MRVRINCLGVPDVLEFESQRSAQDLQREDLFALGRVILSLGTRSYVTPQNMAPATGYFASNYSQELQNLVAALCRKPNLTVAEAMQMASVHIMDELDMSMASTDALHGHLSNEYQNGRLLRLLFKLGAVNERPSHGIDTQWSETGDRYILKLFRDYVFHQVLDDGTPVLDFGHIVSALNKLDAGDDERILLTSRDDKSMLVVSYADVKRCLEQAFQELYMQSQGQAVSPQSRMMPSAFAGPGVSFLPPATFEHPMPHPQAPPHAHPHPHQHPPSHPQQTGGGRGHRGGGGNGGGGYRGGRGRRSGRFSR
jgi:PAB-dependent poly(A)-specific ribonuclease subunit 3